MSAYSGSVQLHCKIRPLNIFMSLSFLKGKRIESIRQHLGRVVTEAIWRSPSVILLDDLDHLVNEASSPEQEMNGEAQYSAHISQGSLLYKLTSQLHRHS